MVTPRSATSVKSDNPIRPGGCTPTWLFDPARRARILSRHPDRVFAFLEKAGLVDDEHAVGIAQSLKRIRANDIAKVVRRPGTASQKRLHAIGLIKPSLLGHQPGRLALHARKQAINKSPRAIPQFAPRKRHSQTRLQTLEFSFPLQQRSRPFRDHGAASKTDARES